MFEETLRLGYMGGSGGFILLHSLLLSDTYYTSLGSGAAPLNDVIKNQWNIASPDNWKSTEAWPDNTDTMLNGDITKKPLLYFCNPSQDEFFSELNNLKSTLLGHALLSYNNIKSSSWPLVKSFDDFNKLELSIKEELISVDPSCFTFLKSKNSTQATKKPLDKTLWLYTDIVSQNELAYYKRAYYYHNNNDDKIDNSTLKKSSVIWNNTMVDKNAAYFLDNTDIQIKLQDFINDPEILVKMKLIDKVTDSHIRLIDKWISLHPSRLLKNIGIHRKPKIN